ncbi:MAG: hypothetical protein ABI277_10930 [Burkholderiaceae bacterium]
MTDSKTSLAYLHTAGPAADLMGRQTIAGAQPNGAKRLKQWIAQTQHVEPGSEMPVVPLDAQCAWRLHVEDALVRHIESIREKTGQGLGRLPRDAGRDAEARAALERSCGCEA